MIFVIYPTIVTFSASFFTSCEMYWFIYNMSFDFLSITFSAFRNNLWHSNKNDISSPISVIRISHIIDEHDIDLLLFGIFTFFYLS